LRDALSLLDQVIAACGDNLEEGRVRQLLGVVPTRLLKEMTEAVHAADGRRVLEMVSELAGEGYELTHFAGEYVRYIRNLMIARNCGEASPLLQVPTDERATLGHLAGLFSEEDLTRFFQILLRTEGELRYSLAPRFHLEMGLLKLVHARRLASLESLLAQLGQSGPPAKASPAAPPASGPPQKALQNSAPASRPEPPQRSAPVAPAVAAVPVRVPPAAPPISTSIPGDPLESIKHVLFEQSNKFLSSCLDHVSGWRFEDGEVRFLFPKSAATFADLIRGREQSEKLRAICTQVLGEPVRICVTLEEPEGKAVVARPGARERAEQDPVVEAFRKKFECTVVDVKDLSQE
jgi:DNA polymerase-3 subunit gamma/tau